MNINRDVRDYIANSDSNLAKETMSNLANIKDSNNGAKRKFETYQYDGFYLVNEYVEAGKDKQIISSNVISNEKEIIMKSSTGIEVVSLGEINYLINSEEQTLIIEIVNGEVEVLTSVSRLDPGVMYKITEYLNKNGLVVLTDYNKDERRNFEYLYDFKTGKRISSGFDTIDEINGKLKVTYGLATGDLDLEGNFVMEPDKEDIKPKGFFARLFGKR